MEKQSNPSPPDIKLKPPPPPPSIGIFREDGGPGAPATLLGKAFAIDEDMPYCKKCGRKVYPELVNRCLYREPWPYKGCGHPCRDARPSGLSVRGMHWGVKS